MYSVRMFTKLQQENIQWKPSIRTPLKCGHLHVLYTYTLIGPTYMYMYIHVEMCTEMTSEMRTPPVIRALQAVPTVSAIEGFHCNIFLVTE